MKKKEKIGLVLGGGGGKGAYQVGVLKALKEYKVDKYITHISGTSIGAINAAMYLSGGIDLVEKIWSNMSNETILTKKNIREIITDKSVYSREGFLDIADKEIDFDKISDSKIETYVIASPVGKRNYDAQSKFKINGLPKDDIINILLASSAIPYAFDPVTINGIQYKDGFAIDNLPINALKEEGCTTILVVPLKEISKAESYSDKDTRIIDFVSQYNDYGFRDGTLDFDNERAMMRIEHGYQVGKQLIEQLIKDGVIAVKWRQKLKRRLAVFGKKSKYRLVSKYHSIPHGEYAHKPKTLEEDGNKGTTIIQKKIKGLISKVLFKPNPTKDEKDNDDRTR